MIAFLRGTVFDLDSETLTVDVSGVGYELNCSLNTLSEVSIGNGFQFFVHTHVREDALQLFGFLSKTEKHLFLSLVKVNGIGPKMAIKILSGASLNRLIEMIEAGDVKGLSQLPKVGKKTAEQMILTLKGKLVVEDSAEPRQRPGHASGTHRDDVTSALVHLGFRLQDVERVVGDMAFDIDVEDGIRKGLAALTQI